MRLDSMMKVLSQSLLVLAVAISGCRTMASRPDGAAFSAPLTPTKSAICGPNKRMYFHWAPAETASLWLKQAGATSVPVLRPPISSMPHTSIIDAFQPAYAVNRDLISCLRTRGPYGGSAGPGIYLSAHPLDTAKGYGDTLLVFRLMDDNGKGLLCDLVKGYEMIEKSEKATPKTLHELPLFVEFESDGSRINDGWFVINREGIRENGEHVTFGLAKVGDADAYVDEWLSGGKFAESLAKISKPNRFFAGDLDLKGQCLHIVDQLPSFPLDLWCRAIPKYLKSILSIDLLKLDEEEREQLQKLMPKFSALGLPDFADYIADYLQIPRLPR